MTRASQLGLGLVLVLAPGVSFSSPGDARDGAEEERSRVEQEVRDVLLDYHRAASDGDAQGYFAQFSPDAVVLGTAPGQRYGLAEFRRRAEPMFAGGGSPSASLGSSVVVAKSGRLAWFDERLERPRLPELRRSGVLRKEGSRWRYVQSSLVLPIPNELVADVVKRTRSYSEVTGSPQERPELPRQDAVQLETAEGAVRQTLRDFHAAGLEADAAAYFSHLAEDALLVGTDPTERFTLPVYRSLLEPVFARGRGLTTAPFQQNVFIEESGELAWFDQRLWSASLGELRGTGVLRRDGERWKIVHYVFALLVPDEMIRELAAELESRSPQRVLTPDQARQDLEHLRDGLASRHPSL